MEATSQTHLCDRTVGDVVAEDYRRADAFRRYGIDFCCGGNRTVRAAAAEKGVDCDALLHALAAAEREPARADHADPRAWEPDFLATYIVNVHHRYVRRSLPMLRELTQTVARVHGGTHAATVRIAELTEEVAQELTAHMEKEETVLFPHIERLCEARRTGTAAPTGAPAGAPIEMMEEEHDHAGMLLRQIHTLSDGFTAPAEACTTWRMAYERLEAFEADLHRHVHLENNILFPAALRMEHACTAQPA